MFCDRPFHHMQLNVDGSVKTCCPGWIRKPIGDWRRQTLDEIWKSADADDVRNSITEWSFRYCNRKVCPMLHHLEHLPKSNGADTKQHTVELRLIMLSLESTCNLTCPACRNKLVGAKQLDQSRERVTRDVADLFNKRNDMTVMLSGSGEPMTQRTSLLFLSCVRKTDANSRNRIHLFTNGTLLRKNWAKFPNADEFHVTCFIGIDAGTKETYEINRRGGRWRDVLSGIDFATDRFEHVALIFVLQANNYREAQKAIEIAERLGCDEIRFSAMMNWGTWSESEYKKRAVHIPGHPEHDSFVDIFKSLRSDYVRINMTTLTRVLNK